MTLREFCAAGRAESLKLGVHAGVLALAAACLAYNVAAWRYRRERHLAVNTVAYGLIVGLECRQIARHLERR